MSIDLTDYLFNAGTALVLDGERELQDADLARLRDLSDQQRGAITCVVLSNTDIRGECLRYLASLPNLKALYANHTRIGDDAPLECLAKTVEVLNLDHTEVGDGCLAKLRMAPKLRSIRLGRTGVTDRGIQLLATIPNLREYHVDGTAVSGYAKRRLRNTMELHALGFRTAMVCLFCAIQLEARKLLLRVGALVTLRRGRASLRSVYTARVASVTRSA